MLEKWVGKIDAALRKTAGSRMVSEWAKKVECRDALREISLDLPDSLPPELSSQTAFAKSGNGRAPVRNDGLTRGDLELIDKCRAINAETWLKVAQWGTQSKKLHWKVAGIARTMGEYAIGGWERSPSAKQAKWAMEAYATAEKERALDRPLHSGGSQ